MLFITQEGRLVDTCFFIAYSVVYAINTLFANTYSSCYPLPDEYYFAMQSGLFVSK